MLSFGKTSPWIITETGFDADALGKCEANLSLGNGYMGLRSATEEKYLGECRDMLVAGTFNKFSQDEVTELPNAPDVTNIELDLDGARFDLTQGRIVSYERALNIRTGLLTRDVVWISPKGKCYRLRFERVVSLKRLHTIAMRVSITPAEDMKAVVTSGIDGRVTNTGTQHFAEGGKRFYEKKYMQYVPKTIQSGITFVVNATHAFAIGGDAYEPKNKINILPRKIFSKFAAEVPAGATFTMEKFANVYTDRDRGAIGLDVDGLKECSLEALAADAAEGFDALAAESAAEWEEKVWKRVPITIEGNDEDAFMVHFAQYHMQLMVPAHDNRMNIGAKGFTGEGYKGHTFWDTEVFLLPYYIFTQPEVARSLEEYRYLSLPGAHRKAKANGYEGAQYPWESAWLDDGEVTPEYMGTDVVTGQLIKVWTGFIEIHISADVAFGAWQYYTCTGDEEFMDCYGYELILDTAKFWASRLEWSEDDGKYHINDVVGPDEYKEHVNDNAFTNYMAWWNIKKAIEYTELLKARKPDVYNRLGEKLDLVKWEAVWDECLDKIALPAPREDGVLPQDSTYLTLEEIDLSKYKNQAHVGGIYDDYNQEQITKIQVSKQADVMVLFFLLEDLFPHEVKAASWNYYEPKCLHDSSLSLSTHSVLACDMEQTTLAYDMFRKACRIDLDNGNPHSSDAGIHAASYGGLWQCVVYGFGGLRMLNGKLLIRPALPDAWEKLTYTVLWKGQKLEVTVTKAGVTVKNLTCTGDVEIEILGKPYTFRDMLMVKL